MKHVVQRSGATATAVALLFGVGMVIRAIVYAASGTQSWLVVTLAAIAGPVWIWFWLTMGARYQRKRVAPRR